MTKAKPPAGKTTRKPPENEDGLEGAMRALALALDKKALEPVLLDVRELCSFCNYQLVVSGRSDRQVGAIADGIAAALKGEGHRAIGSEGSHSGSWVLLDVRELCSFCNYQLVISGRSDRQVDAIADGIELALKQEGLRPISSEGARSGQWALIDYGDFVVHVFLHSAREHYDLEGLWNDAPRVPIDVPPDARVPADDQYDASFVS